MAPIKKSIRGLILAIMLSLVILAFTSSTSLAIPYLQLDIAGGTYDSTKQTIVAHDNRFTLYAYMTGLPLNQAYYISAALAPKTDDPNRGSFIINSNYFSAYNGTAANNTVDLATDIYADYGVPPHYDRVQGWDTGDLYDPAIFPTCFKEFKFYFSQDSQMAAYDTMARAMDRDAIALGDMYYATFEVDTSELSPGNAIRFDLYTVEVTRTYWDGSKDYDVKYYAPLGYDAESLDPPASVPDASIMFLLGPGLVGLGLFGRRKFKK